MGKLTPKKIIYDVKEFGRNILAQDCIIHIITNREFILEAYKGILEYSEKSVKIKTHDGAVAVHGDKLELKNISDEVLCITGKIKEVKFD